MICQAYHFNPLIVVPTSTHALLCQRCPSTQAQHAPFTLLNQQSLAAFLQITSKIIQKIREWIQRLSKEGYSTIFQPIEFQKGGLQPCLWINGMVREGLEHTKNVLKANRQYISSNLNNYGNLQNQQLLKDLFNLIVEKDYLQIGQMVGQMNSKLIQKVRTDKLNIQVGFKLLSVHEKWLKKTIEEILKGKEDQIMIKPLISHDMGALNQIRKEIMIGSEKSEASDHEITFDDILLSTDTPELIKQIDSFYEILNEDNKQLNTSQPTHHSIYNRNILHELQEEDHLKLMKSELSRVSIQNVHLRSENNQLKDERQKLQTMLIHYQKLFGKLIFP